MRLIFALVLVVVIAVPARADMALRKISGDSPVPTDCTAAPDAETATIRDSETQASLAYRPHHPDEMAAVWTQDWDDATVLATTSDGWQTSTEVAVPGMVPPCVRGGGSSTNPRVSIGPDGTTYVISNTTSDTGTPAVVNVLRNGAWSGPTTLDVGNGWPRIVADPVRQGVVYATVDNSTLDPTGSVVTGISEYFFRSADFGATWTDLGEIAKPPDGKVYAFGVPLILPDATLTLVFEECNAIHLACSDGSAQIRTARSADRGTTWNVSPAVLPGSPEGWMDATVDQTGAIVVAFAHPDQLGWAVEVAKKAGGPWSAPRVAAQSARRIFHVTLASSRDGIAVLYADNSSTPTADIPVPRDVWLARSSGAAWTVARWAGPTDESFAPPTGHEQPMGEWEGLVGLPDGNFAGVVTLSKPQATTGRTDIFYGRT